MENKKNKCEINVKLCDVQQTYHSVKPVTGLMYPLNVFNLRHSAVKVIIQLTFTPSSGVTKRYMM